MLLCAADTFRAAAIEQLEIWGQRTGTDVIRQKQGADPTKWRHYTLPCPQRFSGPASQLVTGGAGAHAALSLPLSLLVSSLASTQGISVVAATGNESTAEAHLDALILARTAPANTKPGRYKPPDQLLAFLESL